MIDMTTKKPLVNGVQIPCLAFGTCTVERKPYAGYTVGAVEKALRNGFRLIDTATCYENAGRRCVKAESPVRIFLFLQKCGTTICVREHSAKRLSTA